MVFYSSGGHLSRLPCQMQWRGKELCTNRRRSRIFAVPIDLEPRNNDGGKAICTHHKEACATGEKGAFALFDPHYQPIDRKNTKNFTRNPKKRKKALADEHPAVV